MQGASSPVSWGVEYHLGPGSAVPSPDRDNTDVRAVPRHRHLHWGGWAGRSRACCRRETMDAGGLLGSFLVSAMRCCSRPEAQHRVTFRIARARKTVGAPELWVPCVEIPESWGPPGHRDWPGLCRHACGGLLKHATPAKPLLTGRSTVAKELPHKASPLGHMEGNAARTATPTDWPGHFKPGGMGAANRELIV